MASKSLGGRPRIPWTATRRRKLVRLYLMTDLTIPNIRDILKTDGFAPGTRNIQTQLSLLLQHNVKAWRQYRPSGKLHGKTRLTQVKRCWNARIDGKVQRSTKTKQPLQKNETSAEAHQSREISPFYDPIRHYEEPMSSGILSHCSMQQLSKRASHEKLNNNQVQTSTYIAESREQDSTDSRPNSTPIPQISRHSKEGESNILHEEKALLATHGVKRSYSKVASVASDLRRNLSWRNPSRESSTRWSQVNSILSFSMSWRSNLVSKMSSLSRRSSSMNASSWMYEFIDRSKVGSISTKTRQSGPGSLYQRSCCSFFEGQSLAPESMTCDECGYSQAHHLARFSLSDDLDLIDSHAQDLYGNTPLHHAAAAGNTVRVLQLMSMVSKISTPGIHHRNSSGQTYLHVLGIQSNQDFPDLVSILLQAKKQGLRLSERDHSGSSIKEILQQLIQKCGLDKSQQREITRILTQEPIIKENLMNSSLLGSVTVSWATPGISDELEFDEEKGIYLGTVEIDSPTSSPPKNLQPSITTTTPPPRSSRLTKKPATKQTAKLSILDRDTNGDTLLLSTLKKWTPGTPSTAYLQHLISHSNIHSRDCHEYTALAIAARRGLTDATTLLLEQGANPNTKSAYGTSVLEHVAGYLWRAQKEEDTVLYARILACMVLLVDFGAVRVDVAGLSERVRSGVEFRYKELELERLL